MSIVLLVLGTKPKIGKTMVAMTILRLADKQGLRAAGMKPVETGCPYTDDHDLWARDGDALRAAVLNPLPPLVTAPYRFSAAGTPVEAMRRAGMTLTIADLVGAIDVARANTDLLVVEAPGDIDTAVAEDGTSLDLALATNATVLLVAGPEDDLVTLEARMPSAFLGTVVTRADAADGALLAIPELGEGDDALSFFEAAKFGATLIEGLGGRSVDS